MSHFTAGCPYPHDQCKCCQPADEERSAPPTDLVTAVAHAISEIDGGYADDWSDCAQVAVDAVRSWDARHAVLAEHDVIELLRQDVARLTRERNEWEANEQEQYREVLLLQGLVRKVLPHHCPSELTDGEVAAIRRAFDNGHAETPGSSDENGREDPVVTAINDPQEGTAMPTGADLIAAERRRQIEAEGWTPEHDDEHAHAELSAAAAEYLRVAHMAVRWSQPPEPDADPVPYGRGGRWPWHISWWKPSQDPIRNLVKAGALIAAEIDRLHRLDSAREAQS